MYHLLIIHLSFTHSFIYRSIQQGGPAEYLNVTNVPNSRLLKLTNPEKGNWTVEVRVPRASDLYTYRVFSETPIDFTFILLSKTGSSIDSSPIKGNLKIRFF